MPSEGLVDLPVYIKGVGLSGLGFSDLDGLSRLNSAKKFRLFDIENSPLSLRTGAVVMGWSRPNKAGSIAYRKTYARRPFHEDRYHYWH